MGKQKFSYSNLNRTTGFHKKIQTPTLHQCVIMMYGDKTRPTLNSGIIPNIPGEIKEQLN
jgi:hypothetical protein